MEGLTIKNGTWLLGDAYTKIKNVFCLPMKFQKLNTCEKYNF